MEKKLSFEAALEKLEGIVKALESGDLALEDAIAKYQEGMELAKFCHEEIKKAENVIVKMMKNDTLEDFSETDE